MIWDVRPPTRGEPCAFEPHGQNSRWTEAESLPVLLPGEACPRACLLCALQGDLTSAFRSCSLDGVLEKTIQTKAVEALFVRSARELWRVLPKPSWPHRSELCSVGQSVHPLPSPGSFGKWGRSQSLVQKAVVRVAKCYQSRKGRDLVAKHGKDLTLTLASSGNPSTALEVRRGCGRSTDRHPLCAKHAVAK